RVNIHVRARSQLRGPALDLGLQAVAAQQTADLLTHVVQRRDRQPAQAALRAPGAVVVAGDLLVRDEDQRREALLDVGVDLQLPFHERAYLVLRQLGALDGGGKVGGRGEARRDLVQPRLDRVLRDVRRAEALD